MRHETGNRMFYNTDRQCRQNTMFKTKFFKTDRAISLNQLLAVDWYSYDIECRIEELDDNNLPIATLTCDGIALQVQLDEYGNVSQFTSTHMLSRPHPYILNAFWNEFGTMISTDYEDPFAHIRRELASEDGQM